MRCTFRAHVDAAAFGHRLAFHKLPLAPHADALEQPAGSRVPAVATGRYAVQLDSPKTKAEQRLHRFQPEPLPLIIAVQIDVQHRLGRLGKPQAGMADELVAVLEFNGQTEHLVGRRQLDRGVAFEPVQHLLLFVHRQAVRGLKKILIGQQFHQCLPIVHGEPP